MVEANAVTFARTICSICYEDLKPIVEDLQTIFICGHVFHELCLQQWFEYCTNGKKKSCPVCKQNCSKSNVGRLYFQSIGDPNDPSLSQKPRECDQNSQDLYNEVKRLEGKVLGLSKALELQEKNIESANSELLVCKEQLRVEVDLKNVSLQQKAILQQLLDFKSKELDKSTSECTRLQGRNMALAKELAAIKLISDLNLEEDEVLKLASLGNELNIKETIEVLKKSLAIRNKSYKELMIKCNILGRGEARSLSKLEKAKEKIKKLKERVKELESAVEVNDNKALRTLKTSKEATHEVNAVNSFDQGTKNQKKWPVALDIDLDPDGRISDNISSCRKKRKLEVLELTGNRNETDNVVAAKLDQDNQEKGPLVNDYANVSETCVPAFSSQHPKPLTENGVAVWKCFSRTQERESEIRAKGLCNKGGVTSALLPTKSNTVDIPAATDRKVMPPYNDVELAQPLLNVRKETSSVIASQPGDRCFSAGLLGPDGTNWHLGKWCKRVQNREQTLQAAGSQGTSARNGDLIAVGADGRGGKIKVLRSLDLSSMDNKENLTWARKCKYEGKVSTQQSHGCLQIEHFFGRSNQS